jgi:2-polyprenyl-6-methoxyphenol hydroxylase-like FAD-dependent oxidoreductase
VDGVVLVGDAAGYNDPMQGQGLSITLRDVRIVRDLLLAERPSARALASYPAERRERMRRLRFAAALVSRLFAEFRAAERAVRAVRAEIFARQEKDPTLGMSAMSAFTGPEALPAEAFSQAAAVAMFGAELPGIEA